VQREKIVKIRFSRASIKLSSSTTAEIRAAMSLAFHRVENLIHLVGWGKEEGKHLHEFTSLEVSRMPADSTAEGSRVS